jgi:hypothetical protein
MSLDEAAGADPLPTASGKAGISLDEAGAALAGGAVESPVSGKAGTLSSFEVAAGAGASEGNGGISWARVKLAVKNRKMKTQKRFIIRNTP